MTQGFEELLEKVNEVKSIYVKAQKFRTASYLREIEKLVYAIAELNEEPMVDPEIEAKIEVVNKLFDKKYGTHPQSTGEGSEG